MFSFRAEEPANPAADAGNELNRRQKRRGSLLYTLTHSPVLRRRLHPDLSAEEAVDGAGGPEEAEGGCLRVRGTDPRVEAGLRLFLVLPQQESCLLRKILDCSRRCWTITVVTVAASPPWPRPLLHQLPVSSRTPVNTPPLILPILLHLRLKSDIQPCSLESPPPPCHRVSPLLLILPNPRLLHHLSPTTRSRPEPSLPLVLRHPG